MFTLTELAAKYKSDKGTLNIYNDRNMLVHDYTVFYDKLFYPMKNYSVRLLDIGGGVIMKVGHLKCFVSTL